MNKKLIYRVLLLLTASFLGSCMGGGQAPVISRDGQVSKSAVRKPDQERVIPGAGKVDAVRRGVYTVVRGDTLYSIAWRYQLDYKQLADWNQIRSPYIIHIGQKIRLKAPLVVKQPPVVAKKDPHRKKPVPSTPRQSSEAKQVVTTPGPDNTMKAAPAASGKFKWQWPARGKLIASNSASNRNGIAIQGVMGQTVTSAAPGKVVYSGNGLVGYGNLIIVKHNQSFLSAYAHNSRLLVSEGADVAAGQPIAEMGNSGTNNVKLYFEIRKDGKSVDPLRYLPK